MILYLGMILSYISISMLKCSAYFHAMHPQEVNIYSHNTLMYKNACLNCLFDISTVQQNSGSF